MPASRVAVPVWSIALLSAAALGFEVLLTRLFSIIQWHHFSYMIISLALLGYGASGSFLALVAARAEERFAGFFGLNAALFGLSAVAGFLVAQQIPFNALELAWDARQSLYLLLLYLLLAIPFFCVANCIGLAFIRFPNRIHRIYAFDMAGAGAGALGVVLFLSAVCPVTVLWSVGMLGLLGAWVGARECAVRSRWAILGLLALLLIGVSVPQRWERLHVSQYKALSQALRVVGAEKLIERSGPLGQVSVVRNRQVPFRYAPGLSLAATAGPPEQLGLFIDGNDVGAITRFTGAWERLSYLDYVTSALPYHLLRRPHVLILGAGGGTDVLQALYERAVLVDAVELNPQVVELVKRDFAGFTGGLYDRDDVRVHVAEARGFVAGSDARYDLIQVALLDAFSTAAAGLFALSESYLYTVEAFEDYLGHLNPGGLLAVTRWLRLPPRDSLKLLATAIAALERLGIPDPGARVALIRSWNTTTLVVKNGRLGEGEIAALRAFCRERSFDPDYYPGMAAGEANRYNVLERPFLYEGARALLGPAREEFFRRYKFDVRPATDDRPYFFHFFKWRVLPELMSLRARSGLGQLEWGYLVPVATLIQALLAGVVFILLPPWLIKAGPPATTETRAARWRVLIYFLAIGLGFLFLEVAFIQRFILFLSHPLYAVSAVLCAFLIFAGLGSGYCRRLDDRRRNGILGGAALGRAIVLIAASALAYLMILPPVFRWALDWPDPAKVGVVVMLIAPLAFGMGMPFPLGLARVSDANPRLVPWAWAINGCASVISAVLATLLAVEVGFTAVVSAAVILYFLAGMVAPRVPAGGRLTPGAAS